MADKSRKSTSNVPGKYYVDTSCISCGQCIDVAPDFFAESADGGMYIKSQPVTDEGMRTCEQALASCPVDAIGNDG